MTNEFHLFWHIANLGISNGVITLDAVKKIARTGARLDRNWERRLKDLKWILANRRAARTGEVQLIQVESNELERGKVHYVRAESATPASVGTKMSENVTLSPSQEKAIIALLTHGKVRAAARSCRLSERQLYRWLKEKPFQSALQAAQSEAMEATVRQLVDASSGAVTTLRKILTAKDATASAKVRAAEVLLTQMQKVRELAEFEARLEAIESAFRMRGAHGSQK